MEENKYEKDRAFFEDFHALLQKHGMMLLSGNPDSVKNAAKGFEGTFMFLTRGEKKLALQGGEHGAFSPSCSFTLTRGKNHGLSTIKIIKTKFKPEEQ